MSTVHLEITLHEGDEAGRFAEWEMWRLRGADGPGEWITQGTAATLEAAIDKALLGWAESKEERRP